MHIRVGLENEFEGRSLAWALDYPGCFAYGPDASTALVRVVPALIAYQDWVGRHTTSSWLTNLGDFDVRLSEVWQVYRLNEDYETIPQGGYEVNAWFQSDWLPLTRTEVRRAAQLLEWTRADLLSVTADLTDAQLDAIARSGGVVGVNFFVGDLRPDGAMDPETPLDVLIRHVRYLAERMGVEHVALGSDFDGALIPTEIGDATGLPRVVRALEEAGFRGAELEGLCWRNWVRVLGESWRPRDGL